MQNKVTPCNNPNCENCNECCSMTTSITDKELEEILLYIQSDQKLLNKIKNKIMHLNYLLIKKETINFKCLFTSEKDKKCMIYEVRPFACREFHCDTNAEIYLEDKAYDMLHIFNHIVDNHLSNKKEILKLQKVYRLSYINFLQQFISGSDLIS